MSKVLTVEDHPGSRDYLASLLRYAGHEVLQASDGQEGLELAHRQHPDLVITDILMPTMDGSEFVRRLRQDPSASDTPVMFYTASYRMAEAENVARESGVERVLPKTALPADLLNSVEEVLHRTSPDRTPLGLEHRAMLEETLTRTRGELDRVSQRLAAILDASRQLLSLQSPDELLNRLCELAREIVGSRYAVIAVTANGRLEPKHVSGLRLAVPATVGGLAARWPARQPAVRLTGIQRPSDAGLPDTHPPLRSLLAARLTGIQHELGILYCADKMGAAQFSEEDEYLLISLATQAATAHEKVRLFAEAERRALELKEEIESRHRAEERLLHAQKMDSIGKLAGGISHDFNNLLTVIKGYGAILMAHVKRDDPLHEPAKEILGAADRAAQLVRQLLAFSRRQVMAPTLLDLNSVVTGMDRMLRRLIGEHIELVTFPGAGLGLVRADPGQLEQVVVNLAVNARDAMPSGGKLTVELANVELGGEMAHEMGCEPGSYVRLAVSDTGVGMSEEVQRHIFEPFFTTKEPGKGTGLGLATVYGIVKQSGGHVWVYSEPGKGSTFKIYLPRVMDGAHACEAVAPVQTETRGSEVVLLVEDESSVRRLTRQLLRGAGYTVLEAANGSEGLRVAEEYDGRIDMLITDLVMPELGGHELLSRMRACRPETRVLYMSGYAGNAVTDSGTRENGAAFIEKPFAPPAFLAKVRNVLDRKN